MKKSPVRKVNNELRSSGERIHELAVLVFIAAIILFLMTKIVFY
jgi:hypothetical protein